MKPPAIDDLRNHWNAFAQVFEQAIEPTTLLLARAVMAHLRLGEARAVLEVGTGPGAAAVAMHEHLPEGARLVATDLSPSMVALARAKVHDPVEVVEANCEELPYEAGTFDRLLSNLSLMLTPDADRALAEAHRVLLPGGIAGWSVWGRPELSHMFTVPMRAAKRIGMELPPRRSNFHLGDRDDLRARVAGHGFERVNAWYQAMMFDWRDGAHFADTLLSLPTWADTMAGQTEATRDAMRSEMVALADEHLQAGEPLGLDALIVVAHKP